MRKEAEGVYTVVNLKQQYYFIVNDKVSVAVFIYLSMIWEWSTIDIKLPIYGSTYHEEDREEAADPLNERPQSPVGVGHPVVRQTILHSYRVGAKQVQGQSIENSSSNGKIQCRQKVVLCVYKDID